MKKIIAAVALSVSLFSCGKSQCDTLKDACAACKNTTGKAACDLTVSTYNSVGSVGQDACKVVNDAKTYAADSVICKAE